MPHASTLRLRTVLPLLPVVLPVVLLVAGCLGGCAGPDQLRPDQDRPDQIQAEVPAGHPARDWNLQALQSAGPVQDLSPEERDVILHLNLVRANPAAYARIFILPRRALFENRIYRDPLDPRGHGLRTYEGSSAVDDAAAELRQTAPMPPLSVSEALTRAARRHVAEQAETGATGHYGRGQSQPSSRVDAEAAWERLVGEVAAYGPAGGREIVGRLLIDDGVMNRGHRRCILDPRFNVVGVAIGPHPRFGRAVVVDFADGVAEARP